MEKGLSRRSRMRRKEARKRRDDAAKRGIKACEVRGVDRVSELPDDVLILVIGRLSFREAAATSILSRRWRHLYTHHAAHLLHFSPFKLSWTNDLEYEKRRFRKHIDMINRTMEYSHEEVKELKLYITSMFELEGGGSGSGSTITKRWAEFAMTKDLIESVDIRIRMHRGVYMLGLSELVKSGQRLAATKCLKTLRLEGVGVDDGDMELLVSTFTALESLCIGSTKELERVSIVGHPKLKHLDINHVSSLLSLEVRDVANLSSLRCLLPARCSLQNLQNLPSFAQLYATERKYAHTETAPYGRLFGGMPPCIRNQLQLLHLSTALEMDTRRTIFWQPQGPFPFVNLKHLVVEVSPMRRNAYYSKLCPLLEACQSIEKLTIKFMWTYDINSIKYGKKGEVYCHREQLSSNLKEVEMEGYAASMIEFRLATYIVDCAQNLERMLVVVYDGTETIRKNCLARAREDFQRMCPPSRIRLRII